MYSFEISEMAVVTDGTGVEVGAELGVAGTSVAVGASVITGKSVADGDWVKMEEEDAVGAPVGAEESSRVAQATRNKAAVRHGMKYLLSFFMTGSFRYVSLMNYFKCSTKFRFF